MRYFILSIILILLLSSCANRNLSQVEYDRMTLQLEALQAEVDRLTDALIVATANDGIIVHYSEPEIDLSMYMSGSEHAEHYLTIARSIANTIAENPAILDHENFDQLYRLRDDLGIEELHVTDEEGILMWGTIPDYYGFDYSMADSTALFLPALTDTEFELVQDPQSNYTGHYFQYFGIARYDKRGIIQMGIILDVEL